MNWLCLFTASHFSIIKKIIDKTGQGIYNLNRYKSYELLKADGSIILQEFWWELFTAVTPPRTARISELKSKVLKPTFLT